MSTPSSTESPLPHPHGLPEGSFSFAATHWSVVLEAATSDTTRSQAALETLCRTYWHPLYAYVRRRGYGPEESQDLTQEFFARLLERQSVATVHPDKGRFRSFLLASMRHFLADEWDKATAQKRGGKRGPALSLEDAETWFGEFEAKELGPEKIYERRWAITLLEQVYARLEAEFQAQGKESLFRTLRSALAGHSDTAPYAELAVSLGMTEGSVKVAVHRMRQRYRQLLRQTIAETVARPEDVEDELQYLLKTLAG